MQSLISNRIRLVWLLALAALCGFSDLGASPTTAGLDESGANRAVGVFQGFYAQAVTLYDAPQSIADWLCGSGDCQPTRGTMTDAINAYGESLLGATDPSIHEQMEGQLLSYIITTLAIPGAGEEEMETGGSASWLNNIRTTTAEEEEAPLVQQLEQQQMAGPSSATTRFVSTQNGIVDMQPTVDRINSGGAFPSANDGTIFQNREGLLPTQSSGYYNEYVVPTPGVSGPGPMRIVTGQGGELYFTPDHYQTFVPLNP